MPLNEFGQEVPDPTPVVIRVKNRRISQFSEVRDYIRRELSQQAENIGHETFEEANDFDVPDDPIILPDTPHEYSADQEDEDRENIILAERAKRRKNKPKPVDVPVNGPPAAASPPQAPAPPGAEKQ